MKSREQITIEQLWYVFQEHETCANVAVKALEKEIGTMDHTGHIELKKKLTKNEQKLLSRMLHDCRQIGALNAMSVIAKNLNRTLTLMSAKIGRDLYEVYKDQILEDEVSKLKEMQCEKKTVAGVVPSTDKSKPIERVAGIGESINLPKKAKP